MTEKKTGNYAIAGGIMFAIVALRRLVQLANYRPSIWSVLYALAFTLIAIGLLMKHRPILRGGLAMYAAATAVTVILRLADGYYNVDFYRGDAYLLNVFLLVPGLLDLAAKVAIALIAWCAGTERLPQYREIIKQYWFVPAICVAGAPILDLVMIWVCQGFIGYVGHYPMASQIFNAIYLAAACLLAVIWIVFPDGMPEATYTSKTVKRNPSLGGSLEGAYCGMVKHVLLLIFTFGIWYLIWIYRTTDRLNCVQDEEPRNPTNKLLLCMFVPLYLVYWIYKSAQRIDKIAEANDIPSDLTPMCTMMAVFAMIFPPIFMQEKINLLATSHATAPGSTTGSATGLADAAAEVKKYKELLDAGAITPEEYDVKKKQLLGL